MSYGFALPWREQVHEQVLSRMGVASLSGAARHGALPGYGGAGRVRRPAGGQQRFLRGYVVLIDSKSLQEQSGWCRLADAGALRFKGGLSRMLKLFSAYPFLADAIAERCVVVEEAAANRMMNLANPAGKNRDSWRGYLTEVHPSVASLGAS